VITFFIIHDFFELPMIIILLSQSHDVGEFHHKSIQMDWGLPSNKLGFSTKGRFSNHWCFPGQSFQFPIHTGLHVSVVKALWTSQGSRVVLRPWLLLLMRCVASPVTFGVEPAFAAPRIWMVYGWL
jgi:hypothetical protein